jgi:hypothetical protein
MIPPALTQERGARAVAGLSRLTELSAHERHAENRQRGLGPRGAADSFAAAPPALRSPPAKTGHQRSASRRGGSAEANRP